ncbi:hypothetical protein FHS16_003440 [Paenibacillus endophyticus]|uniref:Uncharacterized protein n=1 Tax=Paenibacillus endophyticus TaxID=1294268 RepID=A0A7W5C915_9BACL|nr:hypothetical protein [Paenibacillus endophyticus]MBB3153378.1 hypothetical protein [Paenibacillus endophyticus]
MGLLYEMVLKKRKSAFLMQQLGKGNEAANQNISHKMLEHASTHIKQQIQQTT